MRTEPKKLERNKQNCSECKGLCCIVPKFSKPKMPVNKSAAINCQNLCSNYTCRIHDALAQDGWHVCTEYTCHNLGVVITSWAKDLDPAFDSLRSNNMLLKTIAFNLFSTISTFKGVMENEQLAKYRSPLNKIIKEALKEASVLYTEGDREKVIIFLQGLRERIEKELFPQQPPSLT